MVQSVIVMNASNYNKQNSNGNSFLYKFPKQITFHPMDKIGIQSASIFNSFYNITSKLNNNLFKIVFPCNNPSGAGVAVMQGYIGNSIQFTGEIENPPSFEISGSTISNGAGSFTGFIGGNKIGFINAYISGNTLYLVTPNSAPVGISTGMYINGSNVSITSINSTVNGGNTTTTYTLSSSTLSPIGSSISPVNSIFACGTGKTVYITSVPTKTLASAPIFIQATGLPSQLVNEISLQTTTTTLTLLSTSSNVYLPSSSISVGIGSSVFNGTASATVFNGMTFTYNNVVYTIIQNTVSGTAYTITLDKVVGIFPTTLISNVGIPNNSFSILTVSGTPFGSGIYLPNNPVTMTISGIGVNPNVVVLDEFSASGVSIGVAGIYKISYNPNTLTGTMMATDGVSNNTILYVSSLTGIVQSGMIFQVGGRSITIGTQITGNAGSVGSYYISTPTGVIPSIYPQQLTASSSFSNNITITSIIPDGYYTADTLNKFIQQTMMSEKLYITDGVNGQTTLFYLEITQNPAYYSLQVNVHPLPVVLSSSQKIPNGAKWTLLNDGTLYNPQLILNPGLQEWFGYSYSTSDLNNPISRISLDSSNNLVIPTSITTLNGVDYYLLSNVCPKLNTINSLVLCCNLINSDYSIPSNVFFNIPLNASFGNLIVVNPFDPSLCNVRGGMEQNIEISFYDTNFNPIVIRDTDITLTLVINKSDIY